MPEVDDWAVVVGVQTYPGLDVAGAQDPLKGPVNDANSFRQWLLSPAGGDLPEKNIDLIGPVYSRPPSVDDAKPDDLDLFKSFRAHYDRGWSNHQRAGRRLYVYMAGHGIEVPPGQPALLMANAAPRQFNNHFLARAYADWFFRAGYFDEILLFMDCCRDNFPLSQPNPVRFDALNAPDAVDRVRYLYGFGTKWSRRSRERDMDGMTRGVFSAALLAGLKGGAADRQGQITAASLRQFLYDHLKDFLDPADVASARLPQQPDFDPWPRDPRAAEQFVIVPAGKVAPLKYPVRINVSAEAAGWQATIQDSRFQTAAQLVLQSPLTESSLPEGPYQILVEGGPLLIKKLFEVSGRVDIMADGTILSKGGADVAIP